MIFLLKKKNLVRSLQNPIPIGIVIAEDKRMALSMAKELQFDKAIRLNSLERKIIVAVPLARVSRRYIEELQRGLDKG